MGRSNLHSIPIDDPIGCALTAPLCGAGRCGGNAAPYTPFQVFPLAKSTPSGKHFVPFSSGKLCVQVTAHYNPCRVVGSPRGRGYRPLTPHRYTPNHQSIMAQQTSIHVQPVKGGSEQHNKREKQLDYIRPELFHQNEYWENDTQAVRLETIKARYLKTTGQKMQAKATPIREAVVVIKPDNKDTELYATELCSKVSASTQINREAYDYFRYSFEFNVAEISKNKKTIIEREKKIPDFIGFLSSLVGPSRTAQNRIGYVINAIKKK